MKAARFLSPILAGATLILLGANALPTAKRKHRLQDRQHQLVHEIRTLETREHKLREEIHALEHDPFYMERMIVETWHGKPEGTEEFDPYGDTEDHRDPPPLD